MNIEAPAEAVTPATLTARCVDELSAVPARAWDALIRPGSGALEHGYLMAWERVELSGLRSRPVLVHASDPTRPLAACPGYFYDLDVATVRKPQVARTTQAVRRVWPRFLFARTYELGSPTPLTNPLLVADPSLRPRAVHELLGSAVEEGERCGADFILVQNFTSRAGPAAEELARLRFAPVPILPTAVVDLPYGSFDEYLAAMRAQYRRRAQRTLKRSASLRVERLPVFADLADELARLWRRIFDRASEVKREILTPAFFRGISELEDSSVLLLRRADGSIASFALLLADGPWLSFLHCGFEEDAGRGEGAYFRLLYEIVRLAIDDGFEQVDLGITTLTPKLDVGGVPVPLFAWLKHRNPLFQRVILALAHGPLRPPKVQPRRVFKDPPRSAAELVARRGLPV